MGGRRDLSWDAVLYAASAVFALLAALLASIPLHREWGRVAVAPYAAGAVVALVLVRRGGSAALARAWLAIAVMMGAALLPLGLEVAWRARTSAGLHVQSEAVVTEEAARALVHGRDPYAATYLHGPLAARPLGTKTHFPYLPGMIVFGLPRAVAGDRAIADARVWFAAGTLAVGAAALAISRSAARSKLRAAQVLVVLPTGALLMATGGHDLPVLALLLLALVLAARGRPWEAGIVLGVASAMKQTAWILVPFLVVTVLAVEGRRAAGRLMIAAAGVALPLIGAFAVWNPSAFWEDAVLFPLGLGKDRTPAATPTLGSLLVRAFPGARTALTVALVAVVAAVALYLLVPRPPRSVSGAAARTALVFAVGFALAPAARLGYVVYPIDLLMWSSLFMSTGGTVEPVANLDP